jgi:four helix bundle protein
VIRKGHDFWESQMNRDEMRQRTKRFALRIIRLCAALPNNRAGDVLGRQVLKSGTSIGANYREALRASSQRQFIAIIEIAIREAEETIYWLELLQESDLVKPHLLKDLADECDQLIAIFTATIKTAKTKLK